MSAFQSRSQRRASKQKQLRNERIQRFVADQLKVFDRDRTGGLQQSQTREEFLAMVTERAQKTLP